MLNCRNCGKQNDDQAVFCANCGKKLKKEVKKEQEHIQQTAPKKLRQMLWVLIGGVMGSLVALGVLSMIVFMVKKGDTSVDQPALQSAETQVPGNSQEVVLEESEKDPEEEPAEETGEMSGAEKEQEKKPKEEITQEVSCATIEECSAICRSMSKLDDSRNADENLLSAMAFSALQMEYAKGGNGAAQKLYSNLQTDDETILLCDIFGNFALRSDIEEVEEYHMMGSSDSAWLFKKSVAKQFAKDFYGKKDLDLLEIPYFEDHGDKYWSYTSGDGDPWYEFLNYSIKENEDFYLLKGACAYGDNGGDMYFVGYAKYLFKKNTDSRLGVTLVYSEFDHQENVNLAVSAVASSELAPQQNKSYKASHLIDNNLNTCWVEGVSGTGEGEMIELDLGKKQTVYGLTIYNGYLESKYLYGINGKVSAVTVRAADGTVMQADLMIPVFDEVKEPFESYERLGTENWISFDHPVYTDKITITIDDAVAGSKYEDTCISEIKVY